MIHKHHHYVARAIAVLVMLLSFVYIGFLLDPSTPVTFGELMLETNRAVYMPGETVRVKIPYCSKKEQQVYFDFHLIDTIPVEGEDKPLLLRGPDLPWEEGYKEICEIVEVVAFKIDKANYASPYYVKAFVTYKVNFIKWRTEVYESNDFFILNDWQTVIDQYDTNRRIPLLFE